MMIMKRIKDLEKEFEGSSLQENIVLPVKVGDTIMTGRFKNKKTVVKSIGKDEHGINYQWKKGCNFPTCERRIYYEICGTEVQCEKCNHQWEIESDDDEKYLCHNCGYDSQKGEYDFDAFDS